MPESDDSLIHLLHTLWSLALTGFGGLVFWNWKRLHEKLDNKANSDDVERRHLENQEALKEIKTLIMRYDDEASKYRHEMSDRVQALVGKVGTIEGYLYRQRGAPR